MGAEAGKVWTWWGRDPSSLEDLVFVVACETPADLQKLSVRLGLPSPKKAGRLKPSDRGFTDAAKRPGTLLWMEMDLWATGHPEWSDEEQLTRHRER